MFNIEGSIDATSKQVTPKLTKEQKEAIGILSIGTFLEYFDFYLYINMAVIINSLFFPAKSSYVMNAIKIFTLCSTYALRPFGAILFSYIGDYLGRRITIFITTTMMAMSCILIASCPTYEEIGIRASILILVYRVIQGLSSMGEIIGARIYLTEYIPFPYTNISVALVTVCSTLGGLCSVGLASLVTTFNLNWRIVFWIGAIIANIGIYARTALRETPDFLQAKAIRATLKKNGIQKHEIDNSFIWNVVQRFKLKTFLSFCFMESAPPFIFYINAVYCNNILQNTFGYSNAQIIRNNFIIMVVGLLGNVISTFLLKILSPLKIVSIHFFAFSVLSLLTPFLLNNIESPYYVIIIQMLYIFFCCSPFPADALIYKCFPVLKRFLYISSGFALSKAFTHLALFFCVPFFIKSFENFGLFFVIIPILAAFGFALLHFYQISNKENNL